MKIQYLYRITNRLNNKCYIGRSCRPKRRFQEHISGKAYGQNSRAVISRVLKKYGKECFDFEVIACAKDIDSINAMEVCAISQHNSQHPCGYNFSGGGYGTYAGIVRSAGRKEQHYEKVRKLMKGRVVAESTKELIRKKALERYAIKRLLPKPEKPKKIKLTADFGSKEHLQKRVASMMRSYENLPEEEKERIRAKKREDIKKHCIKPKQPENHIRERVISRAMTMLSKGYADCLDVLKKWHPDSPVLPQYLFGGTY